MKIKTHNTLVYYLEKLNGFYSGVFSRANWRLGVEESWSLISSGAEDLFYGLCQIVSILILPLWLLLSPLLQWIGVYRNRKKIRTDIKVVSKQAWVNRVMKGFKVSDGL